MGTSPGLLRQSVPVNGEIKSLTGLRGIAACLVLIHHLLGYKLGDSRLAVFSVHLYLSVDLFFILSGFVMAMNYASYFHSGMDWSKYRLFLGRRLARIYPLYLFVTIVCLILMINGVIPRKGDASLGYALLTNIPLITAWGVGPYIIGGPAWSISTEWGAYIIFPLLVSAVVFSSWVRAVAVGIIMLIILHYMGTLPNSAFDEDGRGGPLAINVSTTVGPLLRCICEFTLGLLAWRVSQDKELMRRISMPYASGLIGIAILGLLFGRTTDLIIVACCTMFVALLSQERSWTARLLGSSVPYTLGVLSYSIYLVHMPLTSLLEAGGFKNLLDSINPAYALSVKLLIEIPCVLLCSIATYQWIEKPGRQVLRRLLEKPRFLQPNTDAL